MAAQAGIGAAKRSLCQAILSGVRGGTSIAGSLRNRPRNAAPPLSEMELTLIDSAEKGGVLEMGFDHLAEHFRQDFQAKRRIQRALIYPVLLLHFALLVGIGITALLAQVNPNAPPGSGVAMVKQNLIWVGIGYGIAICGIWLLRNLGQQARTSSAADALFTRIPLFGSARRHQALARFCEVFRISLLSGLKMSEAWSGAGRASQSGTLLAAAEKGAGRLASGESLGKVVLSSQAAFPGDLARSFASADEAGQLDRDAAHWADFYRNAAAESMERLAEWAPKIFYWFVLGIAAWMVIRVALSYRNLLEGLMDF